jgi:magnesium transporter
MLSVHLSRVSVRQNEDMRKISAWAAIIAVPTLIAGIYGMNFDHMPELHWLLGYPLSVVLMGAAAGLLFRLFKRSGWL